MTNMVLNIHQDGLVPRFMPSPSMPLTVSQGELSEFLYLENYLNQAVWSIRSRMKAGAIVEPGTLTVEEIDTFDESEDVSVTGSTRDGLSIGPTADAVLN
jgi:hypothetical protein